MLKFLAVLVGGLVLMSGAIGAEKAVSKKAGQKICPVMGGKVNPKLFYTYTKKIYVCCPGCIPTIKKNPDKYIKKVLKEIASTKDKKQKTCPVMGGKVNPKQFYTYTKKIYVCCPGCLPKIKKNPDKYLQKVLK